MTQQSIDVNEVLKLLGGKEVDIYLLRMALQQVTQENENLKKEIQELKGSEVKNAD